MLCGQQVCSLVASELSESTSGKYSSGVRRPVISNWSVDRTRLLHASKETLSKEEDVKANTAEESAPHADERQISLDTDRSFVLYPAGE